MATMKLTPTLTKAIFWDDLKKKYPKAVAEFCKWIDEYKKAVNWATLFNEVPSVAHSIRWETPKFHDLPGAFQVGIWFEYMNNVRVPGEFNTRDLAHEITSFMNLHESSIAFAENVNAEHSNNSELTLEQFMKVTARLTAKKRCVDVSELGPFDEQKILDYYNSGATPYMVASESE